MTGSMVGELYEDGAFASTQTYATGGVNIQVTKASQIVAGTVRIHSLSSGVTLEPVQNSENGGTAGTVPGQVKVQAYVVGTAGSVPMIEMPNTSALIGSVKYRVSYYGS